jgi:hypothetical protein
MEQYFRSVERVHGSGAHGAGIASGLQVSATIGQAGVTIAPGSALDPTGKHIYLAVTGKAEIGPTADNPGVPPDLVTVAANGVVLSTAGFTGYFLVVVQWRETFDSTLFQNSQFTTAQYNHTPWVRLVKAADFNPDVHVVLAKATLDNNGLVTALTYGDVGGLQRGGVTLPAQALHLTRAVNRAGPLIDTAPWGELRSREGGGVQLTVANGPDLVEIMRSDGGSFSKLAVNSDQITGRLPNGVETIGINMLPPLMDIGTSGHPGRLLVRDIQGTPVMTLDGGFAQASVGAALHPGKISVLGAEQNAPIVLEGEPGDIFFRGKLQDPNHSHNGIGHDLLKFLPELTGGGFTTLHRHLNSGDATQAIVAGTFPNLMFVDGGSLNDPVVIQTITLPARTRVFALIAITLLDEYGGFDSDDGVFAEIYQVDGQDHRGDGYRFGNRTHLGNDGDDANVRAPFFSGDAQTVTFRLRSLNDCRAWALAVVFPQAV